MTTKARLTAEGAAPLLMHNAQLSDPLNDYARDVKRLSGKKKKTDEDHVELGRREFLGGLYYSADVGPYVPAQMLEKCLVEGARLSKMGKQIERGLFIPADVIPLVYDGPREPEALWNDKNFVDRRSCGVQKSRVIRTRPVFHRWGFQVDLILDPELLNLDDVASIADVAGRLIGIGNWRPRYGRFDTVVEAL